ncbi:hypothetical protein WAB17_05365 [Parerythrobacter aurantius]|uniref:hypothetical protein n=1 Tax=Parerythrobacter aurantius TaxID=3127706 RepID=UPI00324516C7
MSRTPRNPPPGALRLPTPTPRASLAPPRLAAEPTVRMDPWVLIAFLYPFSQLVMFELVGQLYLIDLLAFPLLLVLLLRLPDAYARLARIWPLAVLLGVWLTGQVVTDLYRATPIEDLMRGWAKIVFFAAQLFALWLWLPRRRAYLVAFAMGVGVAAIFGVPEDFESDAWKFGYDRALVLLTIGSLVIASVVFPRLRYLAPLLFLAIAVFLLLQSARSAFGVLFICAILAAAALVFARSVRLRERLTAGIYSVMLLFGVAAAVGATGIYGQAVETGALGREALIKYRDQTSGEVPLLLGGRTESLVSVRAIADSPIIGHGSWAKDPYYVGLHYATKLKLGLPVFDPGQGKQRLIPTHSYLMGAWVEAGIAGGLFWLWVLLLPFVALYSLLRRVEPLMPLVVYCSVSLVWSVLFSPFGATERVLVAFQLVVLSWTITIHGGRLVLAPLFRRGASRAPLGQGARAGA